MPTKRYHTGLDVRGALKWPKSMLKGLFRHPDPDEKRSMTLDEAQNMLMDELSKGHEILPFSKCDNWDWKKGCLGHEVEKKNNDEKTL